jgi:hypothetical protein
MPFLRFNAFSLPFSILLVLGMAIPCLAAAPSKSSGSSKSQTVVELDRSVVHAAYNDGDFDKVVKALDAFIDTHPTMSRSDSIFIAKHLSVVYSANPETREKGKYYMFRLLELMPSAELVDMFVSDEVDRIFDKVRKEFMVRQQNFGVDSTQVALPNRQSPGTSESTNAVAGMQDPNSTSASKQGDAAAVKSKKGVDPVWWWVAGGAVALGAGITAAILLNQPSVDPGPHYIISASN